MLVTTARIGASFRKEPSLSSDSTTRKSLWPTRAFEPPIVPTRPPTTTVGSSPAKFRIVAIIDVVVVLPWLPGHGDSVFQAHQLGQQLAARDHRNLHAARFLHLGVLLVDRRADHQRASSGDVRRRRGLRILSRPAAASRSVIGGELHDRSR